VDERLLDECLLLDAVTPRRFLTTCTLAARNSLPTFDVKVNGPVGRRPGLAAIAFSLRQARLVG